jgi:hypothetical protein
MGDRHNSEGRSQKSLARVPASADRVCDHVDGGADDNVASSRTQARHDKAHKSVLVHTACYLGSQVFVTAGTTHCRFHRAQYGLLIHANRPNLMLKY